MSDNLTDDILEDVNEGKQYQLNDYETAFITELDTLLQYHIYRQRIVSNFLTYVGMTRLGYTKRKDGYDLQYKLETDDKPFKVRIKEVLASEP